MTPRLRFYTLIYLILKIFMIDFLDFQGFTDANRSKSLWVDYTLKR